MQWNSIIYETNFISMAFDAIRKRLPPDWLLCDCGWQQHDSSRMDYLDAAFGITDPQGCSGTVLVEVKRGQIEARQIISQLDRYRRILLTQTKESPRPESNFSLMVVASFIGPSAKDRLSEAGISFVDSTGNLRFVIDRPAVFIEAQGATKNPWRENAPLRSLKGRRTARVVRGFLDYQPPYGIREIANETNNSPASTSRVSELLEREAIIHRETPRGRVLSVDWERLARRWAADYDFVNANGMTSWLEPRGIRTLFDRLRNAEFLYAVTGSFAAMHYAPVAEPRLAAIYTSNPQDAANRLGLRPADTGGNVLIGRPFDPVVFDQTQSIEGITYARVTQVLVDLMTGPGRGPTEAESLVEWMRSNEDKWQLPLKKAM